MMSVNRPLSLAIGLLVLGAGASARAGITPTHFAFPAAGDTGGTIGFTYAGDKFVGTTYNGGLYQTDLNGNNPTAFGPANTISGNSVEHYVAASLGYGGFANRDVYVTQDSSIIHITNDGSSANTFVTFRGETTRGILFDSVGTFGNDMIVTTTSGNVYAVDSSGNKTLLAAIGGDTEGADIVALGAHFGALDGQLLVSSDVTSQVHAIDFRAGHAVTNPFNVSSAEELSFVPLNLGASGNPLEGFYGSNYTPDVVKAGASQFAGLQGSVIITGESTHDINSVVWNGTSFVQSVVGHFPNQPEDGIFVTAAILRTTPEPATIASGVMAVIAGLALARRRRGAVA